MNSFVSYVLNKRMQSSILDFEFARSPQARKRAGCAELHARLACVRFPPLILCASIVGPCDCLETFMSNIHKHHILIYQ